MDKQYRRCGSCGKRWNVSRFYPADRVYICPFCAAKYARVVKRPRKAAHA